MRWDWVVVVSVVMGLLLASASLALETRVGEVLRTVETVKLTADGKSFNPVWNPDGSLIAFSSGRSGSYDVWSMGADGSDQRRLTSDSGSESPLSWSRDGKWILYVRAESENFSGNRSFWIVRPTGGESKLVGAAELTFFEPKWLVDQKLYFVNLTGNWIFDLQSDNISQAPYKFTDGELSPDGSELIYVAVVKTDGLHEIIARADSDSKNIKHLAQPDSRVSGPRISPSGKKIAFAREVEKGWNLTLMDRDGENLVDTWVVLSRLRGYSAPQTAWYWTFDEKWILFDYTMGFNVRDRCVFTIDRIDPAFVLRSVHPSKNWLLGLKNQSGKTDVWLLKLDAKREGKCEIPSSPGMEAIIAIIALIITAAFLRRKEPA